MAYLVELPVVGNGDSAGVVKVQIIDDEAEGVVRVARPGQVVVRATRSLKEMLDTIKPVAEQFAAGFDGMDHPPDEITVDFGLSLSAQADVIITSTSAKANFSVSLTWKGTTAADPSS